jgi:hypothetical protein
LLDCIYISLEVTILFNKLVNEFEIGNNNENITTMPLVIVNWQQTEFSFTCDIHNNGKKIFLFKSEVS